MAKVEFDVEINVLKCKLIDKLCEESLAKTAEALHTEVVQAEVMPKDTGHMQNERTYVDKKNPRRVKLITHTPYAARLYMHPEYNFQKKNRDAQGRWLDRWISGSQKDWIKKTFAKFMLGGGKK